ncbi:hypothetical protein MNBD_ALPHA06-1216 [hydrothermal vent metagenome]|uniref:Leucine-binding protein domain-containing protein n=1 Tax=hydrothermal vent metagenome TaxID=652676 RepID=A0A3B0S505_9ZZZZ
MFDPRTILCLCLSIVLTSACVSSNPSGATGPVARPIPGPTAQSGPGPVDVETNPQAQFKPKLMPPHMIGRPVVRLALLLPFSAKSTALRNQATSMLDAAELAIFEAGDPRLLLIPKDTGGTREGAIEAAQSALDDGADIMIGPILSSAVSGAASIAGPRGIPIISFSTDRQVAGNGVYLISYQLETEIERIIGFAAENEHNTFALLRGQSAYGARVEQAMGRAVALNFATLTDIQTYPRATKDMAPSVAVIAHTTDRQEAIKKWEEAGGIGDPALDPEFAFTLPYTAILLPESGIRLQSLAPLLPYNDVDPRKTRFLGTALWFDQSLTKEPALFGGWFPGPDQDSYTGFLTSYQQTYSRSPKRLAALAYDAVRVAGIVTQDTTGGEMAAQRYLLENPAGFTGVTGLLRFASDGVVERALAVYQMRRGRMQVLESAPTRFDVPRF